MPPAHPFGELVQFWLWCPRSFDTFRFSLYILNNVSFITPSEDTADAKVEPSTYTITDGSYSVYKRRLFMNVDNEDKGPHSLKWCHLFQAVAILKWKIPFLHVCLNLARRGIVCTLISPTASVLLASLWWLL